MHGWAGELLATSQTVLPWWVSWDTEAERGTETWETGPHLTHSFHIRDSEARAEAAEGGMRSRAGRQRDPGGLGKVHAERAKAAAVAEPGLRLCQCCQPRSLPPCGGGGKWKIVLNSPALNLQTPVKTTHP